MRLKVQTSATAETLNHASMYLIPICSFYGKQFQGGGALDETAK